jgi:hypothetical protein
MAPRIWDRYILNTFPLPHTLLLTLFLTIALRIAFQYHFHYGARPILTLCVVSSLLGSISDTLAQMVEVIRSRGKAAAKLKDGVVIGEIELDEKGGSPGWENRGNFVWTGAERPVDFDFPRLIRFMAFGILFAPLSVCHLRVLIVVYVVWGVGFVDSGKGTGTCVVEDTC